METARTAHTRGRRRTRAELTLSLSGATALVLRAEQAEELLRDWLDQEGRELTLTPKGFSEDGKAWLFAARDSQGQTAALFSVALDTGEIREIPAGAPEN